MTNWKFVFVLGEIQYLALYLLDASLFLPVVNCLLFSAGCLGLVLCTFHFWFYQSFLIKNNCFSSRPKQLAKESDNCYITDTVVHLFDNIHICLYIMVL